MMLFKKKKFVDRRSWSVDEEEKFELPHFDWDRSPQIFPIPPTVAPGYMGWMRFLSDGRMITALPKFKESG